MPLEIEHQLSVGMRYLMHKPRNTELIKSAWLDFEDRLRWQLMFSFNKTEDETDLYDPDYEVPHNKRFKAPHLPDYLETGFCLAKHFTYLSIAKIPTENDQSNFKSLAPSLDQIQEFLISNNYVVTNTDKNLGIAVSERTWIESKCLDILSDQLNYELIEFTRLKEICNMQCTEMEALANNAEVLSNGKQLAKFLRHCITVEGTQHTVPTFYGIPKIHKEPVKMRPIIPCHSAIQNPTAKYISKKLKPIVKLVQTIIHGSKDLVIKLSKLDLQPGRQFFIVTGDVVAFYPNINLDKCLRFITDFYEEY